MNLNIAIALNRIKFIISKLLLTHIHNVRSAVSSFGPDEASPLLQVEDDQLLLQAVAGDREPMAGEIAVVD